MRVLVTWRAGYDVYDVDPHAIRDMTPEEKAADVRVLDEGKSYEPDFSDGARMWLRCEFLPEHHELRYHRVDGARCVRDLNAKCIRVIRCIERGD